MAPDAQRDKKTFCHAGQFFKLQKSLKNWLIERERHP